MAFMQPYYTDEPFVLVEQPNGESFITPASYYHSKDGTVADHYNGKWFARLSADGYMDCTDWDGPFETEQDAREYIEFVYEIDPDTGEDLPDDETAA